MPIFRVFHRQQRDPVGRTGTPERPVLATREAMDMTTGETRGWALLLLVALGLTALAYAPIVRNYFYGDDFIYLYEMNNNPFLEFLLRPHGGHVHVLRNLIFYASHAAFGTAPTWYYVEAFATHLLNVGLLYELIWLFTGSPYLACFGSALWGTAPFNEETLGWYSVYGQVLGVALMLGVLVQVEQVVSGRRRERRWTPYVWYLMLLGATLSFGTGTASAIAFPLMFLLLAPGLLARRPFKVLVPSLLVVIPVLYFTLFWLYKQTGGVPADQPSWFFLGALRHWPELARMLIGLPAYGLTAVLLRLPPMGHDYPLVAAVAASVTFGIGVLALLTRASDRQKRQLLACVVLALGCYGVIAFGRAVVFAEIFTVVPAETVSRYHYASSIPLVIIVCLLLNHVATPLRLGRLRDVALVAWIGFTAFAAWRSARLIDHHDEARNEATKVVQSIQSQIAAHAAGKVVYISNGPFEATGPLYRIFPGWAGVFISYWSANSVDGKRVYFVDQFEPTVAAARARPQTRAASLLIGPRDVPSGKPDR